MLLSLAASTIKSKISNNNKDTKASDCIKACKDFCTTEIKPPSTIEIVLAVTIASLTATMAYQCARPGTGAIFKAIFAFFFWEFYVLQALFRSLIGDYSCARCP